MRKQRKRNKNLVLVAKFTEYSYGYVRQVATGERNNEVVSAAIEAANKNDFEALLQIKEQRSAQITAEKLKRTQKNHKAA